MISSSSTPTAFSKPGGSRSGRRKETSSGSGHERDAPDKPELKVNYALNDAGRVRFDFTVAGIDVPLAGSTEIFPLVLPVSAESGSKAGTVAYNSAVKSGSNDVAVDAAKIMSGPVEETFAWTWRRQAWVQRSDSLVFQASGHKAKVTLTILPDRTTRQRGSLCAKDRPWDLEAIAGESEVP